MVAQAATVAQETVNAAAKTVASPAAQAAKAKGAEAAAAASKAVTSNPDDSNVFSAILGTDSLAVTVLATIVRAVLARKRATPRAANVAPCPRQRAPQRAARCPR